MKIESINFFDRHGVYVDYLVSDFTSVEYVSLYQIACVVVKELYQYSQDPCKPWSAMVYVDNSRVLHVSRQAFTVTYCKYFTQDDFKSVGLYCKPDTPY